MPNKYIHTQRGLHLLLVVLFLTEFLFIAKPKLLLKTGIINKDAESKKKCQAILDIVFSNLPTF